MAEPGSKSSGYQLAHEQSVFRIAQAGTMPTVRHIYHHFDMMATPSGQLRDAHEALLFTACLKTMLFRMAQDGNCRQIRLDGLLSPTMAAPPLEDHLPIEIARL
jgi:hypothetical protein